jgi:hypothetical protein
MMGIVWSLYYVYTQIFLLSPGVNITLYSLTGVLIFVLIFSTLSLLARGWLAIVIPIRSIDPTEKMDFADDWKLYKTHIRIYFWYIFWYSLIIIGMIIAYFLLTIIITSLHGGLGVLFGMIGIIWIISMLTRMYFAWYHMLSEQSGGYKTFFQAQSLTKGKVWKIFFKVLGFALVVWIASSAIESFMGGVFSLIGGPRVADEIALLIHNGKWNIATILWSLWEFMKDNMDGFTVFPLLFATFFAASSVLSQAMFHIFYVRYYLDIREEYDMESSFLRPILKKHEK